MPHDHALPAQLETARPSGLRWHRRCACLTVAVGIAAACPRADGAPAGAISVRLYGLRSTQGQVGCTLFNSAAGFPTDPAAALQRRWCPIASATGTPCVFDPVPPGVYAIACFHDENNNSRLDRGLFGIPTEGTAASNDARGTMGPPSFDKAKFTFLGAPATLALRMVY